jgi:hypothetical protein
MDWIVQMYLASVAGAVFGVFWPWIVRAFKDLGPSPGLVGLPETASPTVRFLAWLVVGGIIGAVVAALGFATFMGTPEAQAALKAQGLVGLFAGFAYGFAGGAFFEEPLKK